MAAAPVPPNVFLRVFGVAGAGTGWNWGVKVESWKLRIFCFTMGSLHQRILSYPLMLVGVHDVCFSITNFVMFDQDPAA